MSPAKLTVTSEQVDGITIVNLDGPVDSATFDTFKKALHEACNAKACKAVLDCKGLTYMNSKSFGLLSSYHRKMVIDMGVVGDGVAGDERACSICAKDSTGPYDYGFRRSLVHLAEANKIPFRLDIYPYYGSDGSAALRAGHDFRVALIGPGVAASHGVERTHREGIQATVDLCMAYIEERFVDPV